MSVASRFNHWTGALEKRIYSRRQSIYDHDLSFTQAVAMYPNPNKLYAYMHHYFYYLCPQILREHRQYFQQEQRAFGENAFHAMWWMLLSEFKPYRMLEIGVYRGQVISLWALISQYLNYPTEIHGISPFGPLGDAVSVYLHNLDYMDDVLQSCRYWKLDPPILVKALSTDPQAVKHIQEHTWDLIYIDGSHDYEIALSDYRLCRDNLNPGGILVLDDASVGTSFNPPRFAFAGHPGPSRVARELADKEMRFLCAVGHNNLYKNIIECDIKK